MDKEDTATMWFFSSEADKIIERGNNCFQMTGPKEKPWRDLEKIIAENQEDWIEQFGTCPCGQNVEVAELNWYGSRVTFRCGACGALHFATIFEEYGVFIIEKEKWIIL